MTHAIAPPHQPAGRDPCGRATDTAEDPKQRGISHRRGSAHHADIGRAAGQGQDEGCAHRRHPDDGRGEPEAGQRAEPRLVAGLELGDAQV